VGPWAQSRCESNLIRRAVTPDHRDVAATERFTASSPPRGDDAVEERAAPGTPDQ
jgi:hypothetical protein